MRWGTLAAGLFSLLVIWTAARARPDRDDLPEKAACRTCEVRGAAHGEEDVSAWREYEGARYYFCSEDCAEAFDGFPAAYVPHPLPRPAPKATVSTLDGGTLPIEDLEGRVVLLDFWATWCAPCLETMPLLGELHGEWGDAGLTVLGISIDEEPAKVVPGFIEKKKIRHPIALDTERIPAWYAFQVGAIPAMFLIDAEGQIVAEWRGAIDRDDVRTTVEGLLAKTLEDD